MAMRLVRFADAFILMALLISGLTEAEAGTYQDDMNFFSSAIANSRFSDRRIVEFENPQVGKTQFILPESRAPWAGNYFPMAKGGIAHRWQSGTGVDLKALPSREELSKMSLLQINRLSPAEKFDLLRGDYEFTITRREMALRGPLQNPPPEKWEGFCNGVRCAGFLLPEPLKPFEIENPDGLGILFQPADLKALAGASYFFVEKYNQIGAPSRTSIAESPPNPAVFDLALRFYLAEKQKPFVIDSHLGDAIWNETLIGYQREVGPQLPVETNETLKFPKAKSKIQINTMLYSLGEVSIRKSNKATKSKVANGELHKTIPVSYTLYLDADGKAIDGIWKKNRRLRGVDFAWFAAGKGTDADHAERSGNPDLDFMLLRQLIKLSRPRLQCHDLFIY
jgi:hypothetical protein